LVGRGHPRQRHEPQDPQGHLPEVDEGVIIAMLSMRDIPPECRILPQRRQWTNGHTTTMHS
jgi:hypothetical protein